MALFKANTGTKAKSGRGQLLTVRGASPKMGPLERRASLLTPLFAPTAKQLKDERDKEVLVRQQEVNRLVKLPPAQGLTGGGTSVLMKPGVQTMKAPLPTEVPPAPTARQMAEEQVIRENAPTVTRTPSKTASFLRGLTMQQQPTDLFSRAQYRAVPPTTGEKVAGAAGAFAGAVAPYGAIAKGISAIPLVARISRASPLLGIAVRNAGETAVDAALQKTFGQDYTGADLVTNLAFGMGAEGLFAGGKALKGFSAQTVREQLEETMRRIGPSATFEDAYRLLEQVPIRGTDVTYGQFLRENREAYLKGQKKAEGTPGLDVPATPPEVDRAARPDTLLDYAKSEAGKLILPNGAYLKTIDNGEDLAGRIRMKEQYQTLTYSRAMTEGEPYLRRLDDLDRTNVRDAVEGRAAPNSQNVKDFIAWWKPLSESLYGEAKSAGVPIRKIDDYFPRVLNLKQMSEFRRDPAAQKQLVADIAAKNEVDEGTASRWLANLTDRLDGDMPPLDPTVDPDIVADAQEKLFARKVGAARRPRGDWLPDYVFEQDPSKIVPFYVEGMSRRIAEARHFGPKLEAVEDLIQKSDATVNQRSDLRRIFNRSTGRESFAASSVAMSKALRTANVIQNMSLSAVTNVGDVTKSFVEHGTVNTLRAIGQSFTEAGKHQAGRSGVLAENVNRLTQEMGDTGLGQKIMKLYGFQASEIGVRRVAANAAINQAEVLLKALRRNPENAFAKRRLADLVDDPEVAIRRGFFSPEERDAIGYRGVAGKQPMSTMDLPHTWQSPSGKIFFQYKSFGMKAVSFVKKQVADEALRGNPMPLIRLVIFSQLLGEPIADVRAFLTGRERKEEAWSMDRFVSNALQVGSLGLMTDVLTSVQYGESTDALGRFLVGPSVTNFLLDPVKAGKEAANDPRRSAVESFGRLLTRKVPFVGPAASRALFPYQREKLGPVPRAIRSTLFGPPDAGDPGRRQIERRDVDRRGDPGRRDVQRREVERR